MEPLLREVSLYDWIGPWGKPGQMQAPPFTSNNGASGHLEIVARATIWSIGTGAISTADSSITTAAGIYWGRTHFGRRWTGSEKRRRPSSRRPPARRLPRYHRRRGERSFL